MPLLLHNERHALVELSPFRRGQGSPQHSERLAARQPTVLYVHPMYIQSLISSGATETF